MAGTDADGVVSRPALESGSLGRALRAAFLPLLVGLMVADLYLIFMWAPTATSGHRFNLQRIFYFHVPIAWVALLAFALVFVGSVLHLWKRQERWDAFAHSAAEVGMVFATLVLITGSLWAKGQWSLWWTWEAKLTTMLILWLIYVAYLMLRGYATSPLQRARFSAVLAVIGFIDVPIIYFAAGWWRGDHPPAVTGPLADSGSLDTSMRTVLMFSMLTFTVLFLYLLRARLALRTMEDNITRLKRSVRSSSRARIDLNQ